MDDKERRKKIKDRFNKFKTKTVIRDVKDAAGKHHKIENVMFDPPLTFVEGKGYIQVFEEKK